MFSMINAELNRFFHSAATYLTIALVTVPNFVLAFLMAWSHSHSDYVFGYHAESFADFLGFAGFCMPPILTIVTSVFIVVFFAAERRSGYLKSIMLVSHGRVRYAAAQLAITIISAFLFVTCSVLSCFLATVAFALPVSDYDVGSVLLMCAQVLLISVSVTTLCLVVLSLFRSTAISVVFALFASTGTLHLFLTSSLYSITTYHIPEMRFLYDGLKYFPSSIMVAVNNGAPVNTSDLWLVSLILVMATAVTFLILRKQAIR